MNLGKFEEVVEQAMAKKSYTSAEKMAFLDGLEQGLEFSKLIMKGEAE